MQKHFKSVLVVLAALAVINVKASYYNQKPSSNTSTKDVIKKSAQFYATSSLVLWGVGKVLQVLSGAPLTTGGTINFDARYNDTFPKQYYKQTVTRNSLSELSRDFLIAGSMCNAPLRSLVSTAYSFRLLLVAAGTKKPEIARAIKLAFVGQMMVSPRYAIIGFGVPIAYHKYQESKKQSPYYNHVYEMRR